MKPLRFLLSYSVFAALCAAALLTQSFLLQNIPVDYHRVAFIFGCTLASYNCYWLVRLFSSGTDRSLFGYFIFIAIGVAVAVTGFVHSPISWKITSRLFVLSSLYFFRASDDAVFSARARFSYYKSLLLALVWTVSTIDLTGTVTDDLSYVVFFLHRLCFMLLLCITFDYRDVINFRVVRDEFGQYPPAQSGMEKLSKGIAWYVGAAFAGAMVTAIALNFNFGLETHGIWLGLMSLLALFAFLASIQQKRSYAFYYLLVDGLMFLSGLGTLLLRSCLKI